MIADTKTSTATQETAATAAVAVQTKDLLAVKNEDNGEEPVEAHKLHIDIRDDDELVQWPNGIKEDVSKRRAAVCRRNEGPLHCPHEQETLDAFATADNDDDTEGQQVQPQHRTASERMCNSSLHSLTQNSDTGAGEKPILPLVKSPIGADLPATLTVGFALEGTSPNGPAQGRIRPVSPGCKRVCIRLPAIRVTAPSMTWAKSLRIFLCCTPPRWRKPRKRSLMKRSPPRPCPVPNLVTCVTLS